ncbi:MAG TPA: TRAP transporter small permease subunit [Aestuariivirgaceae bacterium]|nr:TRAP transporter small permease subunit [Aestuariivirgaceae bacterium]
MPRPIVLYVRYVEAVNRLIGRLAMFIIFAMMGVLLMSSVSRTALNISFIWTVEMAQFMLAAYYLLGGGYSMQLDSHVRMDLLYSRWSPKGQALADTITSVFLIFYLVVLLIGAVSSTNYAITYGQKNYSSWAPPLSPIKIIMTTGIAMMLLQAIAMFFRDMATVRGERLE